MPINRNTVIAAGVVVGVLAYQRRRTQQRLEQAAREQEEQQEAQRRQTGNDPDRVDIGFLLDQQREELEGEAAHISEDKSPAQAIRDNRDELPDKQWENRVELDPETGEPYNPAQYAWLVTNDKL